MAKASWAALLTIDDLNVRGLLVHACGKLLVLISMLKGASTRLQWHSLIRNWLLLLSVALVEDGLRVHHHCVRLPGCHLDRLLDRWSSGCVGNSHFAKLVDMLFSVSRRLLLERLKLLLAHDGLAHDESIEIASIAKIAEAEIQVVAIQA